MSYILEALKRSQQEHKLGEIPRLSTESALPVARQQSNIPWGLFAAAALLLSVALLVASYLLLSGRLGSHRPGAVQVPDPRPQKPPSTITSTGHGDPAPASALRARVATEEGLAGDTSPAAGSTPNRPAPPRIEATAATPRTHGQGPGESAPDPRLATEEAIPDSRPPEPEPAPASTDRSQPLDLMRKELLQIKRQLDREQRAAAQGTRTKDTYTAPATTIDPTPNPTPSSAHLPASVFDLPHSVQRRLPERKISVLAYSEEPARRFIIMDSRKMREGEQTKDGLILDTILQDGVVFRFNGHRFYDSVYR